MSRAMVEWSVPADHPALPGHFPGRPIVPGVVLLGWVLEQARCRLEFGPGASRWQRIKFVQPVGPEQPIRLELDGDSGGFSFLIKLEDGSLVARGQCRHAALA